MASTKYANFIVDARGKIAGSLYQRNGGGSYSRTSFIPTNPSTSKQTQRRARLKSIQSYWQKLTQQQRDAWIAAAPTFPVQNRVGDTTFLTGHQLFVYLNLNVGIPPGFNFQLVQPPPKAVFPHVIYNFSTLNNNGVTMSASFTRTVIFQGDPLTLFTLQIYATKPLTAGASSPSMAKYKYLQSSSSSVPGVGFSTAYMNTFGVAPVGSKVFLMIKMLNRVSGQIEHKFTGSRIVVAI